MRSPLIATRPRSSCGSTPGMWMTRSSTHCTRPPRGGPPGSTSARSPCGTGRPRSGCRTCVGINARSRATLLPRSWTASRRSCGRSSCRQPSRRSSRRHCAAPSRGATTPASSCRASRTTISSWRPWTTTASGSAITVCSPSCCVLSSNGDVRTTSRAPAPRTPRPGSWSAATWTVRCITCWPRARCIAPPTSSLPSGRTTGTAVRLGTVRRWLEAFDERGDPGVTRP